MSNKVLISFMKLKLLTVKILRPIELDWWTNQFLIKLIIGSLATKETWTEGRKSKEGFLGLIVFF